MEDFIAVAYWPPDTHHVRRIMKDDFCYNEGFVFGGDDWAPFGISYRSLVPKASECSNLLAGSCASSSHVAYGAIRLEWTFMALGQLYGMSGQVIVFFVMSVAAAEAAVGLAIILSVFRHRATVDLKHVNLLQG